MNSYKERNSVERVNTYLKGYFLLNQIYYCTGEKAKVHFDGVHIEYNTSKLTVDQLIHNSVIGIFIRFFKKSFQLSFFMIF